MKPVLTLTAQNLRKRLAGAAGGDISIVYGQTLKGQSKAVGTKRTASGHVHLDNGSMGAKHLADSEGTWIYSYGDMITLLLMFFVLLYSISNINPEKFDALRSAMKTSPHSGTKVIEKESSGENVNTTSVLTVPGNQRSELVRAREENIAGVSVEKLQKIVQDASGNKNAQILQAMRAMMAHVDKQKLDKDKAMQASFSELKENLKALAYSNNSAETLQSFEIILQPALFFDTGETKVKADGQKMLKKMVEEVKKQSLQAKMQIEVHTSRSTIAPDSEMLLTVMQAASLFQEAKSLGLENVSASGYGFQQPLIDTSKLSNVPESVVARNRRIVFRITRPRPTEGGPPQ